MISINYVQVPSKMDEDINKNKSIWRNGVYFKLDEGKFETYFIGHKQATILEDETEKNITEAFPVRVSKPYSVDKAVASAVMSAYNLHSSEDYNIFLGNLANKFRSDSNDADVLAYDKFTEWVRSSLECDELTVARQRKISEIDLYDKSKAVEEFNLNGIGMWYKADKRTTIRNLVESSVKEGRNEVTLWTEEEPILPITVSCDLALDLLAKLEVYAGDALAVTQRKKAEVQALQSVEEINAYDITSGYPEKLNLQIS